MSSLADLPEIVGFFSYSRDDDIDSHGALSALRDRIQRELRGRLGRTRGDFRLWQDAAAIPHGTLWEDEIRAAIAQSAFFIPIITPTAVRSGHCKKEFELFLQRERELGRQDLIFPLVYIRVPALEDEKLWRKDEVLSIIGTRQYIDWQQLRYLDANSTEVAVSVGRFCGNIVDALERTEGRRRVASQDHAGLMDSAETSHSRRSEDRTLMTGASAHRAKRSVGKRNFLLTLSGMLVLLLAAFVAFFMWSDRLPWTSQLGLSSSHGEGPAPTVPPPTIRKSASYGGTGGSPFDDIDGNPAHLPIANIYVGVTANPANRAQPVIGNFQVRWRNNQLSMPHGTWPDEAHSAPIVVAYDEMIIRMDINDMDFDWPEVIKPHWVAGLRIYTSKSIYSFGAMKAGPMSSCIASEGESIIAFFGRAGSYIDRIGCVFAKLR